MQDCSDLHDCETAHTHDAANDEYNRRHIAELQAGAKFPTVESASKGLETFTKTLRDNFPTIEEAGKNLALNSKNHKKMTKWEYDMLTDPTRRELDAFGAEGWELVAVLHGGVPHRLSRWFYFKRPLK